MDKRFDQIANEWDKSEVRQGLAQAVFETIRQYQALEEGMDVLDFGAGTGLLSFKIAPWVRSVTAVDLSEAMLQALAAKNGDGPVVQTQLRDILAEPMEERFDLIVSSMAMHHVKETEALLSTLFEHLRPGGAIAIADLDQEDGTFHGGIQEGVHHLGFDTSELEQLLKKVGFVDIAFHSAHTVDKPHRSFDVFLLQARRAA